MIWTFEYFLFYLNNYYNNWWKCILKNNNYNFIGTDYYSQNGIQHFGSKPNVRFFINGKLATKSFFSDITVSNIVSYIQTLLDNPTQEISNICIPNNPTKVSWFVFYLNYSHCVFWFMIFSLCLSIKAYEKVIIGYFENKNTQDYQIFKKLSMVFMDDCRFYAGFE